MVAFGLERVGWCQVPQLVVETLTLSDEQGRWVLVGLKFGKP